MFESQIYVYRRAQLRKNMGSGLILLPGNVDAAFNYPANQYHFRQDSTFLYYFGLDHTGLAGVIDLDSGHDWIFGNNVDMDDIIWMGVLPSIAELSTKVGVTHTAPYADLDKMIAKALSQGREIHVTPPYRGETILELERLVKIPAAGLKAKSSISLIKAVVAQRSIKDQHEIIEIEKAVDTACLMHTTAMKMAMPGTWEQEIAGTIEGIALAHGGPVSFPVILSMNGQTLHNHDHSQILQPGRMMVVDAGCETSLHYASDLTRTVPVGLKFNSRQKAVYEAVLQANLKAIAAIKPGIFYKDVHLLAARAMVDALKEIGLMKGSPHDAVAAGAHALFFPHGLGHMMGLDVHDMENLGQIYVGYDDEIQPASQFGLAFLRLARRLQPGFVLTVEPGCYFIPALIDQWKAEGQHTGFINYAEVEKYKDFGGIRIEDDVLVTKTGYKVLGKAVPKTVAEVECLR
ncbi:MAG: aminopeptidase P family protein [Porphyromonadaceae bacterium]|nr:MAG: aminopeptidase P family protein [Porphyromonadaceae bacterium]